MRVIAGQARGHTLIAPDDGKVRPTADRMKETLFNILAPRIFGCAFLDVFSGSGAVGIEALSRGAASAVFIEKTPACLQTIKKNLAAVRLLDKSEVLSGDYAAMIDRLARRGMKFDIVFLDPPYDRHLAHDAAALIKAGGLLAEDGIIISEQGSSESPPEVEGLMIYRIKKYTTTMFVFMKDATDGECL